MSYINSINAIHLATRETKVPRDRYQQYIHDLYALYDRDVSPESFTEGGHYTYAELGDSLFGQPFITPSLKTLDMIVVAHWSQEFDPDYASCGPYFLHHYQLSADMFDVCDMGSLAPFMALKLLSSYQQIETLHHGMVLCLEQDTIPRVKEEGDVIPAGSGAVAVWVSSQPVAPCYRVLETHIFPEHVMLENVLLFGQVVQQLLSHYQIALSQTQFLLRKNTLPWKLIQMAMHNNTLLLQEDQLYFALPHPGCLSMMARLGQIKEQNRYPYTFIIDEDVESLLVAYCIVEYVSCID